MMKPVIPDKSKDVIDEIRRLEDKDNKQGWYAESDPIEDLKRAVNMLHPKDSNFFLDKCMRKFFDKLLNEE